MLQPNACALSSAGAGVNVPCHLLELGSILSPFGEYSLIFIDSQVDNCIILDHILLEHKHIGRYDVT